MTKEEARKEMRQRRKMLSSHERAQRNQRIRENLLGLEEVKRGKNIFPFVSYGTEADTMELIALFLQQGKRVAVPKVEGREMEFYEITGLGQLAPGYQGIPEPPAAPQVRGENGVMLLPGLAFDRERHRVGYGGGFYDRYLADKAGKDLITVAIAYDFQVVEELSVEAFDWKPDILVTDRGVLR